MKGRFGINIISLFPHVFGKYGLRKALSIAGLAGFEGLHLLPLRGWENLDQHYNAECSVLAYENAWKTGNFFQALRRNLGLSGEEFPLLRDWALFGEDWNRSNLRVAIIKQLFPEAVHITHRLSSDRADVIELSPEVMKYVLTKEFNLSFLPHVVLDIEHILRRGRHGEQPITTNWRNFLDKIEPERIRFIHIKPYAHMRKLISPREYEKLLLALDKKIKGIECSIIFEARPPIQTMLSERLTIRWLKKERAYLGNFFSRD